jgi:glutaconate CoA-transferase subunit A
MAEVLNISEAVEIVKDGSIIAFSGFTIWRRPMAFVYEMIRQNKRHLHLLEVNGGTHSEFLIGAGCVDIWESCWIGHELYGKYGKNISRKMRNGEIIVEDYSHAEMVFRFAAAAAGMPFVPCQSSLGTDIHNKEYDMLLKANMRNGLNKKIPKEKFIYMDDPFFDDGKYYLVPAAKLDIAVICSQYVGDKGTVRVLGQCYSDMETARAADVTIVVAEKIVPEDFLRKDAFLNSIPTLEIDYIVELPFCAHPTGMFGFYDVDGGFIRNVYSASDTQENFDSFLKEWVYGIDHYEYLNKLGSKKLYMLGASPAYGFSVRQKRGKNNE